MQGRRLFRCSTLDAAIATFGDIVSTVTCGRTFADKCGKLFSCGGDWQDVHSVVVVLLGMSRSFPKTFEVIREVFEAVNNYFAK